MRRRDEAALAFNVRPRLVRMALELRKLSPRHAEQALAGDLNIAKALALVKRDQQLALIRKTRPPKGTFRTLVLDPPWKFADEGIGGAAAGKYAIMDVAEIEKMPVARLTAPGAHLYLWVPSLFLEDGLRLLKAWGFTFVTTLVWNKQRLGLGHYARNAHELVLFGVKGKLLPKARDVGTVFGGAVTKHSAKPAEFFQLVERLSHPPYVELFARGQRHGWACWGAEAGSGEAGARHPQKQGAHQAQSWGRRDSHR